jgi:hypothetical protein
VRCPRGPRERSDFFARGLAELFETHSSRASLNDSKGMLVAHALLTRDDERRSYCLRSARHASLVLHYLLRRDLDVHLQERRIVGASGRVRVLTVAFAFHHLEEVLSRPTVVSRTARMERLREATSLLAIEDEHLRTRVLPEPLPEQITILDAHRHLLFAERRQELSHPIWMSFYVCFPDSTLRIFVGHYTFGRVPICSNPLHRLTPLS